MVSQCGMATNDSSPGSRSEETAGYRRRALSRGTCFQIDERRYRVDTHIGVRAGGHGDSLESVQEGKKVHG